jgi:hypothetical protein
MADAPNTEPRYKPIDTGVNQADIAIGIAEKAEAKRKKDAAKQAPAPTPAPAKTDAPAPAPAADDGESAGHAAQPAPSPYPDDMPEGIKEKLGKATRLRHEAQERATRAEQERDAARAEIEALKRTNTPAPAAAPAPTAAPSSDDPRPTLAQFEGDVEKFTDALTDWKERDRERKTRDRAELNTRREVLGTHRDRETAFAASHDDYFDKAYKAHIDYTPDMVQFVTTSEKGPEIAYHLADHPDEAKALNALPAYRKVAFLAELEKRFSEVPEEEPDDVDATPPPVRKATQAPPPVKPVAPSASIKKAPTDAGLSTAERIALWRQKDKRRRR